MEEGLGRRRREDAVGPRTEEHPSRTRGSPPARTEDIQGCPPQDAAPRGTKGERRGSCHRSDVHSPSMLQLRAL
eukprot:3312667-Pyramimonas_sp.AAC.1